MNTNPRLPSYKQYEKSTDGHIAVRVDYLRYRVLRFNYFLYVLVQNSNEDNLNGDNYTCYKLVVRTSIYFRKFLTNFSAYHTGY